MFQYLTGEEVCLGDIVSYANLEGIVEILIEPETELAQAYNASSGGVMFLSFGGTRFLLENLNEEEDLVYAGRFREEIVGRFRDAGFLLALFYADGTRMHEGDEICLSCDGRLQNGRITTLLVPFSAEAWKRKGCLTGFFDVAFEGGYEIRYPHIPNGTRLLKRKEGPSDGICEIPNQ